jgi:hypothetical protein
LKILDLYASKTICKNQVRRSNPRGTVTTVTNHRSKLTQLFVRDCRSQPVVTVTLRSAVRACGLARRTARTRCAAWRTSRQHCDACTLCFVAACGDPGAWAMFLAALPLRICPLALGFTPLMEHVKPATIGQLIFLQRATTPDSEGIPVTTQPRMHTDLLTPPHTPTSPTRPPASRRAS